MKRIVFILLLVALIFSCDLFNASLDPDYWQKIDDEIAWANAPWVPLFIETGGMGIADPTGPQDNLTKLAPSSGTSFMKYEFSLYFQPSRDYPFIGWQAWIEGEEPIAWWELQEWEKDEDNYVGFRTDLVKFVPKNDDGTVVDIFVYEMPPEGKRLYIGPIGADNTDGLNVSVDAGGLGIAFPSGRLPGIMQGYPFNISFQPSIDYPFRGWQLTINREQLADNSGEQATGFFLSTWETGDGLLEDSGVVWLPRNALGTEMTVTIQSLPQGPASDDQITIMPIGGDGETAAIRVAVPEGWGSSSPSTGTTVSRKHGFPVAVEFSHSAAFAFIEWRAYNDVGQQPINPGVRLPNADVEITIIDGSKAQVTVHSGNNVLLVPHCEPRPRIENSNPPLISSGIQYSRGQPIIIIFTETMDADTVKFGEGLIEINGFDTETNEPVYNMYQHFNDPVLSNNNRVTITPLGSNLPPENTIITVTLGTGIKANNGYGLANSAMLSYRVGTQTVRKVYNADNVWAAHNPVPASASEETFFYRGASTSRDRRLRRSGTNYGVTLYFTVTRSTDEIPEPMPTAVKIAEVHYANLQGGELGLLQREQIFNLTSANDMESSPANSPGAVYRQENSTSNIDTNFYKINYTWTAAQLPAAGGIIRLMMMPYRDGADGAEADSWEGAQAEGRFVAVVFDNDAPGGAVSLNHDDGAASIVGGVYYYNNSTNNVLTIDANLNGITDNLVNGGIRQAAATRDRPWTMDEPSAVEWRYRIATGTTANYTSGWFSFADNVQTLVLTDTSLTSSNTNRNLQLQYRDSLGNGDNATGTWNTVRQIRYFSPTFTPVTNVSTTFTGGNTIGVTWTLPANMDGVEVSVNGASPVVYRRGQNQSHTIYSVPPYSNSAVREGQPSSAAGYEIQLTAFSDFGRAAAVVINRWNILELSQENQNALIVITDANKSELNNADNLGAVFAFAEDIVLGGHVPIGTAAAPFTGKVYGNGHTVTITGFSGTAADFGLFGVVDGGTVRDLTVIYGVSATVTRAGGRFGGIAGATTGDAKLQNVLARGAISVSGTNIFAGGFAGMMTGTSSIDNAFSELNLTVNSSGSTSLYNSMYVGGITGSMGDPAPSTANSSGLNPAAVGATVRIENVNVTGNISSTGGTSNGSSTFGNAGTHLGYKTGGLVGHIFGAGPGAERAVLNECHYFHGNITSTASYGILNAGGAVGSIFANANVTNCSSRTGSFTVNKTYTGIVNAGGFIGDFTSAGTVENCYSINNISITHNYTGQSNIGGFAGRINADISYCYAKGNVRATMSNGVTSGGFAGRITGGSVSYSYATGNVTAESTTSLSSGSPTCEAGGFAGIFESSGSLSNCYATGDVSGRTFGYTNNDRTRAGGLVGQMTNGSIDRCFATGSVVSNYTSTYTNGQTSVGGLVGDAGARPISNSAAFGGSVTVTGPNTRNIGRIRGTGTGTLTNNRAFADMLIGSSTVNSTNGSSNHGADFAEAERFGRALWGNSVPVTYAAPVMGGSLSLIGIVNEVIKVPFDHDNNSETPPIEIEIPVNNVTNTAISGMSISDPSGTGIASSTMTSSSGIWNGSTGITNINLSSLADGGTMVFTFNLATNGGSSSQYTITVSRSGNTYSVANPVRVSSTPYTTPGGLAFSDDYWSGAWIFTTLASRGYPILRGPMVDNLPGPALGGQ